MKQGRGDLSAGDPLSEAEIPHSIGLIWIDKIFFCVILLQ